MEILLVRSLKGTAVDVTIHFVTPTTFHHTALSESQGFTGAHGKVAFVTAQEVMIGCAPQPTPEQIRDVVGIALQVATRCGAQSIALTVPGDAAPHTAGTAMTEALLLATYRYSTYKKAPERTVQCATIVVPAAFFSRFEKAVTRARAVLAGVALTRDLVNAPAQDMHPEQLAGTARAIAKASKGSIHVVVLDQAECEKRGMGAYLAVARGSHFPPQFIHLTYTPKKATKKSVAVVGKGVTFDSGGLSLKPADAMMTMKCDMAGAAAVLGLFATLPTLAPNVVVHGIIAAAENMPAGNAMRPGDIVHAANGKTIEILNTDAEGRLTLADALHYATELKPTAILDLATLTGACVVALGEEIAGLMTNDDDLAVTILAAAERAGEKLWELPLEERYRPLIESDVADLRNIPTNRYGGTLSAGLFLKEFVGTTPWAHMDIAGPAFAERPLSSYIGKGGTGYGVRTLIDFLSTFR